MKLKIGFYFILLNFVCFEASPQNIDSILKEIAAEKNPDTRIDLIYGLYFNTLETNPLSGIDNAQKVLLQSQKNNDKIGEAMALSITGANYRQLGNTIKGLEYNFKALALADELGNVKLKAVINNALGNIYNDREDFKKAVQFYTASEKLSIISKSEKIQSFALINLGNAYNSLNKLDSALMFTQRAYELCVSNNFNDYTSSILTQLGTIQGKLGNATLALSYFDLGIKEAQKAKFPRHVFWAYAGLAKYYYDTKQIDSTSFYAKKAIAAVQFSSFPNLSIKPAKLLLDIYENSNSDSAIKYFKIYRAANDSIFNTKAIQQSQLITFEEDIRQSELAIELKNKETERKNNMQYILIAVGIVSFIIFYLLLSRKIITNTKLIEFLGVVALLIVFEFLNLFLHPFLEKITHHSPVLMLIALVMIASLLVPLHHKLEKMAKVKLVEKNKQIRLAEAKKTIKELSDSQD